MNSAANVLWISKTAPYDDVPHGGGKTHNYYLKELNRNKLIKIHLVSMCEKDTFEKLDLDQYGISHDILVRDRKAFSDYIWKIANLETKINPWNRHVGILFNSEEIPLINRLKKLKKNGLDPKIVILQWTQMILLTHRIKTIFPKAKIISIEEDVFYQGMSRKADVEIRPLAKRKKKRDYKALKSKEMSALALADVVVLNNPKDEKLVRENGLRVSTFLWSPYFESLLDLKRKEPNHTIMFYGAMNRAENWKSALWFIERVMPLLEDLDVNFVVVGNRPPEQLKRKECDRVKILGFVEDVRPLFQTSLCLVAPLLYGAGIKIKILEGLSSGIPVLTNDIGAEGIPVTDKQDYFLCNTPEDYVRYIKGLLLREYSFQQIEKKSKELISKNYNLKSDSERFSKLITTMLG